MPKRAPLMLWPARMTTIAKVMTTMNTRWCWRYFAVFDTICASWEMAALVARPSVAPSSAAFHERQTSEVVSGSSKSTKSCVVSAAISYHVASMSDRHPPLVPIHPVRGTSWCGLAPVIAAVFSQMGRGILLFQNPHGAAMKMP